MSKSARPKANERRSFFRKIALVGGATAFAGAARAQAVKPSAEVASTPSQPSGYRVTDHVSEYYRKARI